MFVAVVDVAVRVVVVYVCMCVCMFVFSFFESPSLSTDSERDGAEWLAPRASTSCGRRLQIDTLVAKSLLQPVEPECYHCENAPWPGASRKRQHLLKQPRGQTSRVQQEENLQGSQAEDPTPSN